MSEIQDTIQVKVEYFTGQEEGDVGHPYYVASCVEIAAVTDAKTVDELFRSIRQMIDLHLEGEDTAAVFNLVPHPRIVIMMELPEHYAQPT